MNLLAMAWNQYLTLEIQHPCDRQEFLDAIHRAQHLIMIREVRREHPDIFPIDNRSNI